MQRRTLLAGIASATTIPVLAGCLTGDEDPTEDAEPDDGGNETDNESTGSASIQTLSQTQLDDAEDDSRNVESTATVTADAQTIRIEGQLEAPTPCHEAVVTDVAHEGGTVTIRVELEDTGGMCAQMISEVEYEATIEIEDDAPTHIVVVHVDRVSENTAADVDL